MNTDFFRYQESALIFRDNYLVLNFFSLKLISLLSSLLNNYRYPQRMLTHAHRSLWNKL